jgi:biopolymer transport protein ExbD
MMASTTVKTSVFHTLAGASILNPKHARQKRNIFSDLLLTALIDAFSILVIFLLMSFSSTGELLTMGKNMELPKAALGDVIERNPVVKIDGDKIFLEEKEISEADLVAGLMALREKFKEMYPNVEFPGIVTIQADRRVQFTQMNSIIVATGNAGFSDIKFAVLMK